jgi:hypothetical protein
VRGRPTTRASVSTAFTFRRAFERNVPVKDSAPPTSRHAASCRLILAAPHLVE